MENASKALIIAGAILLSILIIGLGIFIFNQAKGSLNNANLDEESIATFNNKFEQILQRYVPTMDSHIFEANKHAEEYVVYKNVKGQDIKNIIEIVKNNNLANKDDTSLRVSIWGPYNHKEGSISIGEYNKDYSLYQQMKDRVMDGKTYYIRVVYDTVYHYVEFIDFY